MNGILLVAIPLLGAFLLPIVYRRHNQIGIWSTPAILILNLCIALLLWYRVTTEGPQSIAMGGFPAPLGIIFYVDKLALLFAIAVILGTLILWFGNEKGRIKEETLILLIVGGSCGLALSGDLFNIYVFYEIVAVASYGLAASRGTGAGYAASIRFLILSALGSSLLLFGIALIYAVTGTLNLAHLAYLAPQMLNSSIGLVAFALMLIGLGVKAELFPVNTWVPEVYTTAPVRVSALLGGIISKLALLIVVRLLVLMYADTNAHLLLLSLGILGVLTGELAALRATELRQVLAYSSIGQLGLVAIAFAIPGPAGIIAGVAIALHHILVKPALFMLAEAWGGQHLSRLAGVAKVSLLSSILFLVLALSLIGIPPLPGFWAKFLLLKGALEVTANVGWYQMAITVVLVATVIETAYFLRIARLMFQASQPQQPINIPHKRELLPAFSLVALLMLSVLTVGPISRSLTAVATDAADRKAYINNTLPTEWQVLKKVEVSPRI